MKKVLIFVVVLIVAAVLIGPKIVGSQLQGGIRDTVDVINKTPNYTASIIRLESTWFTTNAKVSIAFNMPDMTEITGQGPLDLSVDVNVTSHHGPILISDGFALGLLHTIIQTDNTNIPQEIVLLGDKPFYQFNGVTGLLGTTTYQDEIAAINYTDPNTGGTVLFNGLLGNGAISSGGIAYKATAESVKVVVENIANFEIKGIAFDLNSSESIAVMLSQGLYNSNSTFSMDLISFNDIVQNKEVRIVDTGVVALSDYNKDSDLGNIKVTTSIASLDSEDMNLSDVNAVIEFNNLQAKFLLAYQDFSKKMMDNINSPAIIESELQTFMQDNLLAQLQANPEYNISKLSGKINGSEFDGKIMAKLSGATEIPNPLDDPAFWMQHTVVDSKMMMQKDAAGFIAAIVVSSQLSANPQFLVLGDEERAQIINQQISGMLSGLAQQNMITIEGEEYITTFTLEGGKALLNGNPIPL